MRNLKIKGIWTLDGTLEDEISANDFSGTLPNYKQIEIFDLEQEDKRKRKGLVFEDDKYFSAGSNFDFTSSGSYQCIFLFWWYSDGVLSEVPHMINKKPTPQIAPIFAKADSNIKNGIEEIEIGEFIVSEIALGNKNAIQIALCVDNKNPTHIFQSWVYSPGLHHISILVQSEPSKNSSIIRLDIDGKTGAIQIGPDLSQMSFTTSDFTLNHIGWGYLSHKINRTKSILADLTIMASSDETSFLPMRMIRFGWQDLLLSELNTDNAHTNANLHVFAVEDLSTITTNQIFVEGGNIYAARSNGELLKGTRPIWDTEFDYINVSSVEYLTISKTDDTRTATLTTEGLSLTGTTVRI